MNNAQYAQWLKSLNEGDKVAIEFQETHRIMTITKITPTRRFKIGSMEFDSSGAERGVTIWMRAYMRPITDKIKAKVARAQSIRYLKETDWHQYTDEQLLKVLTVMEGIENETEQPVQPKQKAATKTGKRKRASRAKYATT